MAAGNIPFNEGIPDNPDIAFDYEDSDNFINEISELYNYTELSDFKLNLIALENECLFYEKDYKHIPYTMPLILYLLPRLNDTSELVRRQATRSLLYLVQGCWALSTSVHEQVEWTRKHVMALYDAGVFKALIDLLKLEIKFKVITYPSSIEHIEHSEHLGVILSILYTMVEVIRIEKWTHSTEYAAQVRRFCSDLAREPLLVVNLLDMASDFCYGVVPNVPIKKLVLLIWKLILLSLGGRKTLKRIRKEKREKANLYTHYEDTIEITKTIKSVAPPSSGNQHIKEEQEQKKRSALFRKKQLLSKNTDVHSQNNIQQRPRAPHKGTPWIAKARPDRIRNFIKNARKKFKGSAFQEQPYSIPEPIHQQLETLMKYVYISLADIQTVKEKTCNTEIIKINPVEILYQTMLPNFSKYVSALLLLLLATETNQTETMNINAEIMLHYKPGIRRTSLENERLNFDLKRHKEIIIKAVSSIILLLLQHFKLNHVYQFEFMAQNLVDANCIALILKFFNQDIMEYIGVKNESQDVHPQFYTHKFAINLTVPRSRRTIFSCINMARILCKITKWKSFRIINLLNFSSVDILCKVLEVRHSTLQVYILKLIKMQSKYLGRKWRNANLQIITAIYRNVRHHFIDDWMMGKEITFPPNFQAEDNALRAAVIAFNRRRYKTI